MQRRAVAEELRVLEPQLGTRPRVWYRNLWKFDHCFIGGSVSALVDGVDECIEGANVELLHEGTAAASCSTDAFGDFRFDRLLSHSGPYTVRISSGGRGHEVVVPLAGESIYLGKLELT
jgi:hypothetical protein